MFLSLVWTPEPLWVSDLLLRSLTWPLQRCFCSFLLVVGGVIPALRWRLQRCRLLAAAVWSRASSWEHEPTATVTIWAVGGPGLHHPQHWWAARRALCFVPNFRALRWAWSSIGTKVTRYCVRNVLSCGWMGMHIWGPGRPIFQVKFCLDTASAGYQR